MSTLFKKGRALGVNLIVPNYPSTIVATENRINRPLKKLNLSISNLDRSTGKKYLGYSILICVFFVNFLKIASGRLKTEGTNMAMWAGSKWYRIVLLLFV